MDWTRLQERARAQGGALGPSDAAALETTWEALAARARRQRWPRLHRGAVLLPGTPLDDVAEEASALAAVGPGAVLGRLSAVHRAGAHDRRPDRLELWVGREHRASAVTRLDATLRRVETRRTATLVEDQIVTGDEGVRRTTVARGIVDVAGSLRPDRLRLVVIDAVQRRLVTLDEVEQVRGALPKAKGRAVLARICSELRDEHSDSALERETRGHLRRAGLRPYPRPFPWRCPDGVRVHIDIAFPETWVAVECDGLASRLDRRGLALHHRRLEQIGQDWALLLVDWTRITTAADGFLQEARRRISAAPDRPTAQPAA